MYGIYSRVFLNNLKLRMIAESHNIWQQTLQESNRYFIYKNFKQSRYKEMYLYHIKPVVIRRLLFRFRMGVSVILTHLCPMCTEHEEDDIHFLLHCPVYHDLRVKYLSPFHSPPNEISFNSMLQMDSNMITGLSLYIYHSLQRRKAYCDAL